MNDKASATFDEVIIRKLRKDPLFAVEYLRAAMEDTNEPRVLLIALRQIVEARGGVARVAKAAGLDPDALIRTLSPRGNPRLTTLFAVTKAMGLTLTVEAGNNS